MRADGHCRGNIAKWLIVRRAPINAHRNAQGQPLAPSLFSVPRLHTYFLRHPFKDNPVPSPGQ